MPTQKQYDRMVNPPKRTPNEEKNIATCVKEYCTKVFIPLRDEIQKQMAKDMKMPYTPLKKMPKKDRDNLTLAYKVGCQAIYCNPGCKDYANGNQMDVKNGFVKSVSKSRKDTLTQNGAISTCRNLAKEQPKYYKGKKV